VNEPGVETAQRGGPGPLLRRARETRGLTRQQAAEQLNLDATVVLALESDDLAALGAPVFARGHLRRYGALLGIPDDELLTAYEQARTQPDQPSLVPHSRLEMAPVRSRPVWAWAIGGALLFLLAAVLVAYVSEYGFTLPGRSAPPAGANDLAAEQVPAAGAFEESQGGAGPAVADSGAPLPAAAHDGAFADAPAAGATQPAGGSGLAAPGGAPAATAQAAGAAATMPAGPAAPTAVPPVPPGHVSVTVSFATDSWAEIYDGAGKAVLYDLGRAGTQRTIAAAAPLSVTLGNAPGVTLAVNGRPTALPARPAGQSVARFQVAADGTLR
jgi:cytoskeleton protein RodZ